MENFSKTLHSFADWMAGYRENIRNFPVQPAAGFGKILETLPLDPPQKGEGLDNLLKDFQEKILPGMTHWQHPQFFGYFPAQASEASILAEMLIASMGAQCMSWITSPAATELEIRMMEWLRDSLGLEKSFTGSIHDSASNATMAALIAARERATEFKSNQDGMGGSKLVVYCSEEAHSSIEKAVRATGLGSKNLRKIPVDKNLSMRTELLEEIIRRDISKGLKPFFVVGAFGTTGTTAIDSLEKISKIAKVYGLWHHVDAAYAGALLLLPEKRGMAVGIVDADSVVFNPHKWMQTNFDCSTLFVRDPKNFVRSFALLPEYLKDSGEQELINFRDWGLGLGRRFRALKLYFIFKAYGIEGIQNRIREDLLRSEILEAKIAEHPHFEIVCPRSMNLICFRLKAGKDKEEANKINAQFFKRLNSSGKIFLSHTKVHGVYCLRWVLGQLLTTENDIEASWQFVQEEAKALV